MSITRKQLIEIGSWRLATEMYRHYSKGFQIVEDHPGGGMYDCLNYTNNSGKLVYINRCGSISIENGNRSAHYNTETELLENDIKKIHAKIFEALALKVKKQLPPSTTPVLIYRIISTILSQAAFGKEFWECRSGYLDSSGYAGCQPEDGYFKIFPSAEKRALIRLKDDLLGVPHYRFWFILKNKKPVCCIETTGFVWNTQGNEFDVMKLYKKHHRMWPIVWEIVGEKLD